MANTFVRAIPGNPGDTTGYFVATKERDKDVAFHIIEMWDR